MHQGTVPTVVFVDPDRTNCKLLGEICVAGGWSVVGTAHDIHEAAAMIAQARPAYLITEYKFHDIATGLDLIAQAKRMLPGITTIMMTGWDINDVATHVTAHQPDRILRKPVPPHVLMDLLESLHGRVEVIKIDAV